MSDLNGNKYMHASEQQIVIKKRTKKFHRNPRFFVHYWELFHYWGVHYSERSLYFCSNKNVSSKFNSKKYFDCCWLTRERFLLWILKNAPSIFLVLIRSAVRINWKLVWSVLLNSIYQWKRMQLYFAASISPGFKHQLSTHFACVLSSNKNCKTAG